MKKILSVLFFYQVVIDLSGWVVAQIEQPLRSEVFDPSKRLFFQLLVARAIFVLFSAETVSDF